MRPYAAIAVAVAVLVSAPAAWGELVIVPAKEMSGIESWKEGQSWGAGNFFSSSGAPLTKSVDFAGGEYAVYLRMYTSPSMEADIRILVNGKRLVPPMQAKVAKLGWVRLGSVVLPKGVAEIRVESPTPGTASSHNLAALAFSSTPLDDRVGRITTFTEWLRQELIRLEAPQPAPRTATEARERQQALRQKLLATLGLDPLPPRTPLNPKVAGRIEKDDYVIEKIAYESRPNHIVPALLYLPKNTTNPVPAVISAIGHWSSGKSSTKPQLRAITLARHGYAVLALDPAYAWERRIPGNSEGFEPFVAGGAIAGHMAWDIMRGADYLEMRPEIDAKRLGVTGASGGGLQTFYAGAVDARFTAVMPAVALWSMPELAVNAYYSGDNWVPGISRLGGMGNLIALTAPRAMLIMNVDADYSTSYACEQMVNAARPYYRLLGGRTNSCKPSARARTTTRARCGKSPAPLWIAGSRVSATGFQLRPRRLKFRRISLTKKTRRCLSSRGAKFRRTGRKQSRRSGRTRRRPCGRLCPGIRKGLPEKCAPCLICRHSGRRKPR
ncbi:MAG: acetylxylan esterase [Verrucomicrobiota bacterium]